MLQNSTSGIYFLKKNKKRETARKDEPGLRYFEWQRMVDTMLFVTCHSDPAHLYGTARIVERGTMEHDGTQMRL
jgi:hypothetical protein